MRLIDADALKKCAIPCEIHNGALSDLCVPLYQIDNAPTVAEIFKSGSAVAVRPIEERPQGEWIKWNFKTFGALGDWEYKCSNCEKVYDGEYNFCPNCGADMRGGAE